LGLERRETVWSLSIIGVEKFKRGCASMRRLHLLNLFLYFYYYILILS